MSQREEFISEWRWQRMSRMALCAAFGISRQRVQVGARFDEDRCIAGRSRHNHPEVVVAGQRRQRQGPGEGIGRRLASRVRSEWRGNPGELVRAGTARPVALAPEHLVARLCCVTGSMIGSPTLG